MKIIFSILFFLFLFIVKISYAICYESKEKSPIVLTLSLERDSLCPGDSTFINALISGGDGGPYLLYNDSGEIINNPYLVHPDYSNVITITAKDYSGNQISKSIYIHIMPFPPTCVIADHLTGCVPLKIDFIEINPDQNDKYFWNFGDSIVSNDTSTLKNPDYTFCNDGIFSVWLTKTSKFGCSTSVIYIDLITAYPKPEANFSLSPSISKVNDSIQFYDLSTLSSNVIWIFDDGDSTNTKNPIHFFTNEGNYNIKLIAVSNMGCMDTMLVNKTIYLAGTFLVKVFPNPFHDFIKIETLTDLFVEIFDSGGKLIKNLSINESQSIIDLSNLSVGVYMIRFKDGDSILETKLIKL
ncbi:MAG: T9SS type A sorting domain-containing protein [Bacteroidia bacterium]|nr:T9SS type A sorting domain-containing protein [Bacteroidia bacterium]